MARILRGGKQVIIVVLRLMKKYQKNAFLKMLVFTEYNLHIVLSYSDQPLVHVFIP